MPDERRASRRAPLLLALLLAGCDVRSPAALSSRGSPAPPVPETVRLHLRDGAVLTLRRAVVHGDSIHGERPAPHEVDGLVRLAWEAVGF